MKYVSRLSKGMLPLLVVAIFLPLVVLAGFGVYSIVEHQFLLHFLALLAVCALISIIPLWIRKKNKPEALALQEESFVQVSGDWADFDIEVWDKMNIIITQQLKENSEWQALQSHSLKLISCTAREYKRKELAFTLPELLRMVEEVSRRYRFILATHVPFIEKFSLSLLKQGYDSQKKVKKGIKSASWAWKVYRLVRIASPLSAAISELRGQAINKLMIHVSSEVQTKLKQAFLQEVVSVSIDIYTGRFKVDDEALDSSRSSQLDKKRRVSPLDPLRVCLVGQVSSGKSSVINALTKNMAAEVNTIPKTYNIMVHEFSIEEMKILNLVDLPGLDGNKSTEKKLLEEVINCDLVIWVLKANQPARKLDLDFKALMDYHYKKKENQSRKRPKVIGVLNQVDRLSPLDEWNPPYELLSPRTKKEQVIKDALDHNRDIFDFSILLPLSVSEDKVNFNLEKLEQVLDECYGEGVQAQLNRRRMEAGGKFELKAQAKRVYQSGKSLFKIMKK